MAVATAREGIAREGVDAVPRVVAPALERAASPSRPEDELEKARLQESRDADLNRLAALGDAPTEADDASAEDVVETPDTKVFPALGAKPDAADAWFAPAPEKRHNAPSTAPAPTRAPTSRGSPSAPGCSRARRRSRGPRPFSKTNLVSGLFELAKSLNHAKHGAK